MTVDLAGAVTCVTGGGRGIGRATAALLAQRGAHVVVGDLDGALAEEAAREIGGTAIGAQLDVADPASFAAFLETAREAGPVRVRVNNAGIMRTGPFATQDPAGQQREMEINLGGVMTGMRLVLPDMLARDEGHIANVASMAGKITTPGASVYTATKTAVVALSRAVRAEIAGRRVTISTILPAAVRTDLTAGLDTSLMPLSAPEDVARAIVASCRHGRAEIGIPRWIPPVGQLVEVLPEAVGEAAKRAAGAQRRLAPESAAANEYQSRISG
ncbi:MAG: SDR family NAD(P)-dependent oxidoreductase [Baekduiaceae bacterium]